MLYQRAKLATLWLKAEVHNLSLRNGGQPKAPVRAAGPRCYPVVIKGPFTPYDSDVYPSPIEVQSVRSFLEIDVKTQIGIPDSCPWHPELKGPCLSHL